MDAIAAQSPRLFALPDFRRLWTVGTIVFMVRWLEMLAVSLVTWEATGSAFTVTMLGMLRILPMGLFGAALGALADRVEARSALLFIVLASLATSFALALLAATGKLQVWHLAVASFVNGLAWAADNPVRRLMIGQVVGTTLLGRAMSFDVGSNNASRMAGPLASGIIFAAAGAQGTFALSCLLYLIALHAALTLRYRSGVAAATESFATRLAAGFAAVRADRRLQGTLCVTIIFNIWGWPFTSLIPVVAAERLGLGPEANGLLTSMDGVGAFAGALAMAAWAKPSRFARCYMGGCITCLLAITAFGLAPHPVLAGAALLLTGAGQACFAVMQATLVYLAAPPELRGRVLGILSLCIGLGPIGFLHIGMLADWVGAAMACVATGLEGLLALALTRRLWRNLF
ncbi:MFS transporter [Siccirubricoccus sp. KC 17139]|uniref:MFS transporter n=1 Tax=Siccirubricoccus soli TaxID=2899147 RepID=A0ABT1CZG3_9PROT|nr:MFS transporter [Siccirubricoccus soli]MCP2681170.1 MFS transporter [Siccirubricoccus soli]